MFDDLLDMILWDKDVYKFNREEKDMHPYSIQRDAKSGNYIIVHNILGINKEDIKLTKEVEGGNAYILINGKTKDNYTGKVYSINSKLLLNDKELDISKTAATAKNGLLYIIIPEKKIKETKEVNNIDIQ